jgi:hypothetical protein
MEMQEIDVFIDANGEVKIEVRGVKGQSCLDITKDLEQMLGGQVQQREMTPESNENSQSTDDQQWLQGG